MDLSHIRNFAIIAHIDHGKSTLADRLLEITGVVQQGKHDEQYLDRNPISRERGITIKLAPVRMNYTLSKTYILNLIDTPGHVDFSYEVDRTLACVEGVILLVDATQGVQAQTISNAFKAIEKNLTIIPVVNKIDLPSAETEKTKQQLIDFLGIDPSTSSGQVFEVSAKTGQGVKELLQAVILKIPNPKSQFPNKSQMTNDKFQEIQSLIFDSYYDSHRGVIAFARVFSGKLRKGLKVKLGVASEIFEIQEVGNFSPDLHPSDRLVEGEIGYVVTNLKDIHKVEVGDTIIDVKNQSSILSGYKKVKPMVFASIFPTDTSDYLNLKKALEKLYLNDSSLEFSGIHSKALGAGFRVGFLGLLHADVVRERLEREFNLSLVLTPPQVEYKSAGEGKFSLQEPWVKIFIITPNEYVGAVMRLCEQYRAKFMTMDNKNQIMLKYEMPLSEMISDFYDSLKSVSSGYASLDWEFFEYRLVEADKLLLLINGDPVEEFSEIVVKERSFEKAHMLVKRLRDLITRQQYEIKIQAQYKGKIVASERIAPFRKDVLIKGSKVVGAGDVGRKRKLLEKQKMGKKKMKMIGKVEVPKEAFLKLFRRSS
ncbi:elongation factor 4 [Candidatus Roizmanbacteria bacterium RIFCSPHIGHO2_02_FULL_39_9]|uniref:Elongation factor 4 n=2 Tax=Candidatus Roizmaniibacteriota TaxID=1752723 RepID=A0A1F7HU43_9BACT|nr:MAG: elongation factor 4 [Candidatus Roizmanbacteria bacterium RIFCSPHIGHO2_02_FULL_39_9]OGK34683.1 MAG: elongation factor 4 [Candidatus Roizmanbacteria bacterium RIFCSPHIGHO2_12_FULL_39_8]